MKFLDCLLAAILMLGLLSTVGCGGGGYPKVSGKVTADGQPVPMVRVVFTPVAEGDNHFPGPYSMGVTDEQGIYVLRTRDGETGAVEGAPKVGFEWADVEVDEVSSQKEQLEIFKDDPAKVAEVERRIAELKKAIAGRPKVGLGEIQQINISSEGTDSADFDVSRVK